MKHFYLMCCGMVVLSHGSMTGEIWSSTSHTAAVYPSSEVNLSPNVVPVALGVSGRVTDENGSSFPGVNVIVKGTAPDSDGNYAMEVPDANGILVFSFVGYFI